MNKINAQEFILQRSNELHKYKNHPIFEFLKKVKKRNKSAFLKILFCFGEIDKEDTEIHYPCDLYTDKDRRIHNWCKKAFLLVCPNINFGNDENKKFVFDWKVCWKTEDMDEIIFNKYIFPFLPPVPMESLEF